MKEQIQKPMEASRAIQREAKAANQAGWQQVLQKYAPKTVQRESLPDEDELVQGKFEETAQLEALPDEDEELIQGKFEPNRTGLPDNLKTGIENLSGYSMNDVRVHYNSPKPAQLQALAYTQGTDIHVAPGQEKHLPHEAWHVVQQKQGRVQPTVQLQGVNVNDDAGLEKEADVMGGKVLQRKKKKDAWKDKNTDYEEISVELKKLWPQAIAASNAKTHIPHGASLEKHHSPMESQQETLAEMYKQSKGRKMTEIQNEIDKLDAHNPSHQSQIIQLKQTNIIQNLIQFRKYFWYRLYGGTWKQIPGAKSHDAAQQWIRANFPGGGVEVKQGDKKKLH
jgi:hypothetical protein